MPKWLTPPAIAESLGIDPEKVITWIRRGELQAVNVATNQGGRPRYRVSESELERFLAARSAGPAPKVTRRKRAAGVIQFFCWGLIMALTTLRPVDRERQKILADAVKDVASLATQVIASQSSLTVAPRKALEVLVAAAKNARNVLA